MADDDALVMLDSDCRVTGVDGGAPRRWIGRYAHECADMPERVQNAALEVVGELATRLGASPIHRKRLPRDAGGPAFTVMAIEAIPLSYTEVPLEPLVRQVLEPIRKQAERARVELSLEFDNVPSSMWLDESKIGWALATLAGSALRHVRDGFPDDVHGGRITVRIGYSASQRRVIVDVTDDGPGMPEHVRAWLIEPNPATGRATGLALRLVYDVVRAHGGHMLVKTSQGTQVSLWLPTRT